MGTAISYTECSQVAGLIQNISGNSSKLLESTIFSHSCPSKITAMTDHNCHVLSMHKHKHVHVHTVYGCTRTLELPEYQECIRTVARVRVCNYIKFETGRNLPQVLKIVTRTVQPCVDIHVSHCC